MTHVHQVNNKSTLLKELDIMKRKTPETTKTYWMEKHWPTPLKGGMSR